MSTAQPQAEARGPGSSNPGCMTQPTSRTNETDRSLRLFRVGAWCWVVTGVGHTLADLSLRTFPSSEGEAVDDFLRAHSLEVLGLDRTYYAVTMGFSLLMGLCLVFVGILLLRLAALGRDQGLRPPAMLGLVLTAPALAISAWLEPPPPIVVLGVACLAFALAARGGGAATKVPVDAHDRQPWRIHELAADFDVLDVWAFRAPGAGPDDLPVMVDAIRAAEEHERDPLVVRVLVAARLLLGMIFGWDGPDDGATAGGRVASVCERLPDDLRQPASGMPVPGLEPFTHLYALRDEHALEVANKTVHAIVHLGWVQSGRHEYELRMAVLVKPNGLLGRAYLAAIAPFRHLIVYPALTRKWERAWRDRDVRQEEQSAPAT